VSNAQTVLTKFNAFLASHLINVTIDYRDDDPTAKILIIEFINSADGRLISHIEGVISGENIVRLGEHHTRRAKEVDAKTILVSWITTSTDFLRRGYGKMLLIYFLCFAYIHNPDVEYSTLDDDTDFSESAKRNIYAGLWYEHRELVSMASKDKLIIPGPEKQLVLKPFFGRKVLTEATELLRNMDRRSR
jgi:hypothetical protein